MLHLPVGTTSKGAAHVTIYVCVLAFARSHVHVSPNSSISRSITCSRWALTTQPWYSGCNKHTHTHSLSYESNRLARSHHSHTDGSVTRERGIQQQALSIQTGNPPQATHTHTHTTVDQWVLLCEGQSNTKRDTHTRTSREMKRALGIRERDKGQREQYVSSDLNSLIWHPAICHCSAEQMLTLHHTSLNTNTHLRAHTQMPMHRRGAACRRLGFKLALLV